MIKLLKKKTQTMDKHHITIGSFILLICFFALFWGCEKPTETPQQTKKITQKISVAQTAEKKSPVKPEQKKDAQKPDRKKETTKAAAAAKPETAQGPAKVAPVAVKPKAAQGPPIVPPDVAKPQAAQGPPIVPPDVAKPQAVRESPKVVPNVAEKKPIAPVPVKPLPHAMIGLSDLYNSQGKLDPFEPLFQPKPVASAVKKKQRTVPLTPLEKVSLSQLKLVAIIRSPTENKAMVQEATGKGYIVKKGTHIGLNSGKIVQILKDRIIVEEEVEDVYGKTTISRKSLQLQKSPGE